MKRILGIASMLLCLMFASCGVGTYSHSSGMDDKSYIMFTSAQKENINVVIDGKEYHVTTVKTSAYKARRDIKKSATTCIPVSTGKHSVKVTNSKGVEVYQKTIFVSTTETKNIEL